MQIYSISRRSDAKFTPFEYRPDAAYVFWTKDPACLLAIPVGCWYAQITITGYALDPRTQYLEPRVPRDAVENLLRLSERIGPHNVVWRYDPLIFTEGIGVAWHAHNFARLATRLKGAYRHCVISLFDPYPKIRIRSHYDPQKTYPRLAWLLDQMASLAPLRSCAEDLARYGVQPARCIDPEILGLPDRGKDSSQRKACGCAPAIDLGKYRTCQHGCLYCYAQ